MPKLINISSNNIINEAISFLDDLEKFKNEDVSHIIKKLSKLSSEEQENPMRVWFTIYQKFFNENDKSHKKMAEASFAYIIKYLQASENTPTEIIVEYLSNWERIQNKSYSSVFTFYENLISQQLPFNEQDDAYWHWRFLYEALMQKMSGDIKIIVPTNALYLIYNQRRTDEFKSVGSSPDNLGLIIKDKNSSAVPISRNIGVRLLLILVIFFILTILFSFI